ncbi:hypothetical protein E3U40_10050 [Campylobacter fetus subsp. venerealis]|uniref:hypothetical protein n=1 Tax=Campylobacter fetus TaxID=196 RepID=UPI0003D8A8DB|nr:hypothetical protein [Campylobacter fetus]AHE95144.1 hypothetical protein CFVI03293_A0017 [Campylobacter fetus subsp. venerealis cfvi03/293]KAA3682621.1 hypothetical protein E3U40_10050 [Campylobacter fetus subsp. venerealis]OCS20977.1 hypothetical protein CFVI97532_09850 [Campylobacter fetus subsp. venerealis cfvi97/532]
MEKSSKVAIYLNEDEYRYIVYNATKNYMPNTAYIRNRIFSSIENNPELFTPKEKEKKRLKVIAISFNKNEIEKIDELATKLNINRSALIKKIVFKDYSNE